MNERLILVTNDDGYDSKGMEAAIEVARAFGRVVVVAPETTQSGMSQAITMYNPLTCAASARRRASRFTRFRERRSTASKWPSTTCCATSAWTW